MCRAILGDMNSYFGATIEIAVDCPTTMVIDIEDSITAMVATGAVNAATTAEKVGLRLEIS